MLWSVSTGASEPNQLNTPQDCDPDYAGDGGSLRRQQFRATTLTGPFPKRPMPEAIHPCCSLSHTEPGILHLSRQTTHRRNSLKKKRGRRGGANSFWDFGERISRPERVTSSETEREMTRAGRDGNAQHGATTAERTLKWRPWGRRVGVKLRNKRWQEARQRHLPRALPLPLAPRAAPQRLVAEPGHGQSRLRRNSPFSLKSCFVPYCRAPRRRGAGSRESRKSKGLHLSLLPPVVI